MTDLTADYRSAIAAGDWAGMDALAGADPQWAGPRFLQPEHARDLNEAVATSPLDALARIDTAIAGRLGLDRVVGSHSGSGGFATQFRLADVNAGWVTRLTGPNLVRLLEALPLPVARDAALNPLATQVAAVERDRTDADDKAAFIQRIQAADLTPRQAVSLGTAARTVVAALSPLDEERILARLGDRFGHTLTPTDADLQLIGAVIGKKLSDRTATTPVDADLAERLGAPALRSLDGTTLGRLVASTAEGPSSMHAALVGREVAGLVGGLADPRAALTRAAFVGELLKARPPTAFMPDPTPSSNARLAAAALALQHMDVDRFTAELTYSHDDDKSAALGHLARLLATQGGAWTASGPRPENRFASVVTAVEKTPTLVDRPAFYGALAFPGIGDAVAGLPPPIARGVIAGVVSRPNLSREVMRGCVTASLDPALASRLRPDELENLVRRQGSEAAMLGLISGRVETQERKLEKPDPRFGRVVTQLPDPERVFQADPGARRLLEDLRPETLSALARDPRDELQRYALDVLQDRASGRQPR